MRPTLPLLALLLVLAWLPTAMAAAPPANTQRAAQRALFPAVIAAARDGTLQADDARLDMLRDYPLFDYIAAARLRHQLTVHPGPETDRKIATFIKNNPNLPPAQRLRDPWLESLGERGRWQLVQAHTRPSDDTADQCRAVHARIESNQNPAADALALWRVGRSQPDTCNPVFAWLGQRGLLSADEILHRARLALLSGHYGMVDYLADKLPPKLAAKTEKWLRVVRNTSTLRTVDALPDDILVYAFQRHALQDWNAAAKLYPELVARLQPGAQARYAMARYVALLLAQDQQPQALLWFARLDDKRMDDYARAWQVRAAIWQRRWPLVIDAIHAMSSTQADDEEWRYWLGRALLETGSTTKARRLLGQLATQRSYHGYLAADLLDQPYSFNARPLPPHPQAHARILALPALARAGELYKLGRQWQFRLEWNEVIDNLKPVELMEAARIASSRGWYSRAIITLARSNYWDALDIRYPTPYFATIKSAAANNALSPAYVLSIIRSESLFQPQAGSAAGAIGLMQLMPATARHVARRNNMPMPTRSSLLLPDINIRLGTHYLRSMLSRFGDNPALATAAYNAGPNAVKRWLPKQGTVPPAIWIANISYAETRNYVQDVMAHMTVFQHRLSGHVVPLKQRLQPIRSAYGETTA